MIWPIIDTFKSYFQLSAPTENLCIDEQMIPFKGHSRLKQYNPQKPKKWGYKLLASPEGQIYNFEVHTGAIEKCPGQPDLQASGNTVMHSYSFHEIIGTNYRQLVYRHTSCYNAYGARYWFSWDC